MAYCRYNKTIGKLGKFFNEGLSVVEVGRAVTCERAGYAKTKSDYPVYYCGKNAVTRWGATYFYVEPGRPSHRVYFNVGIDVSFYPLKGW